MDGSNHAELNVRFNIFKEKSKVSYFGAKGVKWKAGNSRQKKAPKDAKINWVDNIKAWSTNYMVSWRLQN